MATTGLPQQLFQTLEWQGPGIPNIVHKGSIILFSYAGQARNPIHDPYPLVMVTDIFTDMVRGLNLHYLTLPFLRNLITNYANRPDFSYRYIKNDSFLIASFRSYKRAGMSQIRILDVEFLKKLLQVVRALDVAEIEQIRQQVRQMLAQEVAQPRAEEGTEQTLPLGAA
jgi:hypothetical protein